MFAVAAPRGSLMDFGGETGRKTAAHRRELSDKLPPRQFPLWHKVEVLHIPAPLKGVESSSRKSGHFALIWGVFCPVEVLRLVLHFSGVTHVLRCSVFAASGVRTGQSERSVPLGGVVTGSPGCHFTEWWKLMRKSKTGVQLKPWKHPKGGNNALFMFFTLF